MIIAYGSGEGVALPRREAGHREHYTSALCGEWRVEDCQETYAITMISNPHWLVSLAPYVCYLQHKCIDVRPV